jgi:hypothetical protein
MVVNMRTGLRSTMRSGGSSFFEAPEFFADAVVLGFTWSTLAQVQVCDLQKTIERSGGTGMYVVPTVKGDYEIRAAA